MAWQFIGSMDDDQQRLPCDATQIDRFRGVPGEAGVQQLFQSGIEAAVAVKLVKAAEFERAIVDSTVQQKAIAHSTASRLPDVARDKTRRMAKRTGLKRMLTHEHDGRAMRLACW